MIHALTMHTYTIAEWLEKKGSSPQSPPCLGGNG
ncbi:MAG: BolA protein [Flavobacterium sp.]